jgi:hypothetical protein
VCGTVHAARDEENDAKYDDQRNREECRVGHGLRDCSFGATSNGASGV